MFRREREPLSPLELRLREARGRATWWFVVAVAAMYGLAGLLAWTVMEAC